MSDSHDRDRFAALVARLHSGARLVRLWPLEGGVSARVDALEIALPNGGPDRVVVRRHGHADRSRNPDVARDEYRLLAALRDAGLPVPAPRLVLAAGEVFEEPCIVVEFVEGTTEIPPDRADVAIERMAAFLADLHYIDLEAHDFPTLPNLNDYAERVLGMPYAVPEAERIRAALAAHWPLAVSNPPVLLHGDYWPGNILWRNGEVAAVLDWEDAMTGDPLHDLAGARMELHWLHSDETMDRFTTAYTALRPVDLASLPFWELRAALGPLTSMHRWGLDPDVERDMRTKLDVFIARALAELESRSRQARPFG